MNRLEQLRHLQEIADIKSDRALAALAQANAEIEALKEKGCAIQVNLQQQRHDARTVTELRALGMFELWSEAAARDLAQAIHARAADLSARHEKARIDFGKAQVLKRLK